MMMMGDIAFGRVGIDPAFAASAARQSRQAIRLDQGPFSSLHDASTHRQNAATHGTQGHQNLTHGA
jgi:hypothetical protein